MSQAIMSSSSSRSRNALILAVTCLFLFVTLRSHYSKASSALVSAMGDNAVAATPTAVEGKGTAPKDVFDKIYKDNFWGHAADGEAPFSGPGSHDDDLVVPYVATVRQWLAKKYEGKTLHALDLGCGDFNVGKQVRNVTTKYTGADVVQAVVDYNTRKFGDMDTDFKVVDITNDVLPKANVVFIRQVLQHLSNSQIAKVLPKLRQFEWAVITEHLPNTDDFTPNLDIDTGRLRFDWGSGTDLTAEPFNMRYTKKEVMLELKSNGRIRTTAYHFGPLK